MPNLPMIVGDTDSLKKAHLPTAKSVLVADEMLIQILWYLLHTTF
ncbi:MAG: hypothetical protein WA828_11385 [Coleofasciculaceae cyanobacterium]